MFELASFFSPDISQSSTNIIDGVHVFAAKREISTCSSMVVYIPKHRDVGKVKLLCFQVSVPG